MSISNPESVIRIEKLRQGLARDGNMVALVKMYGTKLPEIRNLNTGKKWDDLNQVEISDNTYPMAMDRFRLAASKIQGTSLRILDLGFGNAKLEEILWSERLRISELLGIDISRKSVQRAINWFPQWDFKCFPIERFREGKNHFNYVVLMEVMEHINPSKSIELLKKILSVLRKGGKLIVSVPLNEPWEEMIKEDRNLNFHVRMYTPDLIRAELKIAGFRVLSENLLYAFHKNYRLKTIIIRHLRLLKKKPNNLIIVAVKA